MDNLLTINEICKRMKVSRQSVYYWLDEIPHFKIGKRVRVKESDFEAWLEKHSRKPGDRSRVEDEDLID